MDKTAIRVLVIDDEESIRGLLQEYLSTEGYMVDTADGGADGLEKVKAGGYNVVLCDLKMPEMNGIEVMERIRSHDESVEVILITAYGTISSAVESMKKGAFDYIKKPFELAELGVVIQRAVERRNMQTLLGLYEVSKLIFSTVKSEELLQMIVQLTSEVLGADETSIMLLDQEEKLYIAAHSGLDGDVASNTRLGMGEGIAGRIAMEKKPAVLHDNVEDYPGFEGVEGRRHVRSSIIHPLIAKGRLLGVLNIKRTKTEIRFTQHDLKKATIFASHIAQAIENAGLYRELEEKVEELNLAYDELRDKQERLLVSEKLSALGNMTAGVAHELNNPLTVIVGFTEYLVRSPELSQNMKSMLEKIHLSTLRCRRIIKNLLSFAKVEGTEKREIQVLEIIKDIVEFVSHEMKLNNIQLLADLPNSLPPVKGNSDMLRQVMLSIISNASHSILTTESEGRIVIEAMERDDKVVLRFMDNGRGIPEENLGRIFDPFFTTKKIGEGKGLGLSACYGILKDHGGSISAESAYGEGAVFTVELPALPASSQETEGPDSAGETRMTHIRKVLVIDDEDFILDLCRTVLEEGGYQVDTISDGREGLQEILAARHDLIILDCKMPGIDGKEIYHEVFARDPGLADKIIFISGDTVSLEELGFLEHKEKRLLPKPFKVHELLDTIAYFEQLQPSG